jgi:predicted extracellular nuclease
MGKPLVCGFSEVENAGVVRAIVANQEAFKTYGIVHYESPDARGIDVAMIYDSSKLKLLASDNIRFILPGETKATTRDILWAQFSYKKHPFYVMVNHWPSRRGGTDESDDKRVAAAKTACNFIDSVQKANGYPIIFLGDLNDHPENNAPKLIDERLDPMITKDSGPTKGTHFYNNEWGILDHIYVSANFIGKKNGIVASSGQIHNFPFLMEEYKGNIQPKRTYAGSKYLGGYSDHLPVSIQLNIK